MRVKLKVVGKEALLDAGDGFEAQRRSSSSLLMWSGERKHELLQPTSSFNRRGLPRSP